MNEYFGVLPIDKPEGFTSFDVIAKLRGMLRQKKIGHGGTLDPFATGVLPVFLGRAAKACDILPDEKKRYTVCLRTGYTSDTLDSTGEVRACGDPCRDARKLLAVLPEFTGEIRQLPPMYSAIQVGGQRLYDLARQGIEVERPERTVTIHELSLLSSDEEKGEYLLDVLCSKGTYIRTLCDDIGRALGCGALAASLRRTASAGFSEKDCFTLEQVQKLVDEGRVEEAIHPLDPSFAQLPRITLPVKRAVMYLNGVDIYYKAKDRDAVAVYDQLGNFLAVGSISEGQLRHTRIFITSDAYKGMIAL